MAQNLTYYYDFLPTREFSLGGYLSTTMGRDAWKKAVGALVAVVALFVCVIWGVYALTHPSEFGPSTGRNKYVPNWLFAICLAIMAGVGIFMLPDLLNYLCPVLGIPFADTTYGRKKAFHAARMTLTGAMPTTAFYYRVDKGFERVLFSDDVVVIGDDPGIAVPYDNFYKVFLSRRRRMLVMRFKWNRGPRDAVADLSGLTDEQLKDMVAFLEGKLATTTRCYGFNRSSRVRTIGKRYDPWDCWSAQKKWGGEFRRKWHTWRLPTDAPLRPVENAKASTKRG